MSTTKKTSLFRMMFNALHNTVSSLEEASKVLADSAESLYNMTEVAKQKTDEYFATKTEIIQEEHEKKMNDLLLRRAKWEEQDIEVTAKDKNQLLIVKKD